MHRTQKASASILIIMDNYLYQRKERKRLDFKNIMHTGRKSSTSKLTVNCFQENKPLNFNNYSSRNRVFHVENEVAIINSGSSKRKKDSRPIN